MNVAAIKYKIQLRNGSRDVRQEDVEYFIGTLDDRELAKQLTLLTLKDTNEMEETLRAYQRIENRQAQPYTGSNKFRARPTPSFTPSPTKPYCVVRFLRSEIEDTGLYSDLSGSNGEEEPRRVFVTANSDHVKNLGD